MKITKRLESFIKEVANAATKEGNDIISYSEYCLEYRDQIETNDCSCLVSYANSIGIKIPRALNQYK